MADNISVTAGTGKTIAADEIGGVLHQRVKITVGADGTNDGDVASGNPLPVVQTGTPELPTGAATAAKQLPDGHSVALSATDNAVLDAIAASDASIDGKTPALGQALAAASVPVVLPAAQITTLTPPAAITGFATAAKQDTGNTSVGSIDTKIGEVQASPTANTVLDRLKALLTGIVLAAGSAIIGKVGIDQTTDGTTNKVAAVCTNAGTFATQATLAAETTKVIGTVNVAASQTIAVTQETAGSLNCTEASASAIKTAVEALDNAVDGNYINVNANIAGTDVDGNSGNKSAQTQRVCVATDDVNLSAIKTAVELIDNTVGAIAGAGSPTIDSYTSAAVNVATGANSALIAAPGANKQIWVYGLVLLADVAGSFSLQDEDDTALSGIMPIAATGGFCMNPSGNFSMPWIKVATNKALEIDCVTCTADGIVTYAIVSV